LGKDGALSILREDSKAAKSANTKKNLSGTPTLHILEDSDPQKPKALSQTAVTFQQATRV
jgi:hypothetical protein